ncbi:MAG: hypothetical protein FRX49_00061 [Trebouxia sp. A1-2]|nr:MAG: hypothetical protein FRX49_00061 [Trebouxia sp. A1-2]
MAGFAAGIAAMIAGIFGKDLESIGLGGSGSSSSRQASIPPLLGLLSLLLGMARGPNSCYKLPPVDTAKADSILSNQPTIIKYRRHNNKKYLVIIIMQSPLEQDLDAGPQILHQGSKLCQAAHCCRPHGGILQDDTVVDVADVLGGLLGARALHAQQMQHLGGQAVDTAFVAGLEESGDGQGCNAAVLRTRMALERYKSVLLFMSFIKELVMMMTSSAEGHTSLITKYTMRRRFASLF